MKMRRLLALILACVMSLSLVACGASEQGGEEAAGGEEVGGEEVVEKVLRWNVGAEPEALDPLLMGTTGMQVTNNTFEGLLRTYDGELTPGMAEKYEVSADGLVYTVHLRDAKWSDGKALVAGDFIFAWLRFLMALDSVVA